jgi:hypothetical protein
MTTATSVRRDPPPYLAAAAVTIAVFIVYVLTISPTTAFWDTSEYIAAAKVLGIPHPPGNPLFTLLAHVWGLLPLAASYAERINLFAAATSAATAGLWFLVSERWLQPVVEVRWARLAAAAAGVAVGAFSWTVWNQSTVNEKVYTVSLLSVALVMWLVVHWADDEPGPHRDRWLVLIAYVLALTSTNHLMGVLAAPAVVIYALWTDWRAFTRPWVLVGIVIAIVIGISLNYIYLPMRAGQYPPINEGEPIGFFSKALSDVLNRAQYGKPPVYQRQADFFSQIANYFQYFAWQFGRDWGVTRVAASVVFGALGLWGLIALWVRDRRAGLAAAAMLGTLTLALVTYLNFKYGYSQHPEIPQDLHEVRERDYFFIASFSYFGVLVAVGFGALLQAVVRLLRDRGTPQGRWALATPVLALALVPLFGNRITASRAHERLARDFAVDLLESIEPYGILITAGDNDTFPLWYAQEVEGVRRDVTLANLSLMNTDWHLRQLRRRAEPTFDPSTAAPLWRPQPAEGAGQPLTDTGSTALAARSATRWPKPATPVFSLTESQLDSLPEVQPVQKGSGLQLDSVQIAFGTEYLERKDFATIFLIKDNLRKRPIYFAWSDGGYPDQTLGLTPYLVSTGLVRKLMPAPVVASDSVVLSQGLGYVNVPRSERLMWDVYHWKSAARARPRGWVDPPSASILSLYAVIYGGMSDLMRQRGQTKEAERADSISRAVMGNISSH